MPDSDPRLITVFAEALERIDPADRAAYLDGACEGNAPLRRRVEALLAAHDGAGRFLEPDATGMAEPTSLETLDGTAAFASETPPGTAPVTGESGPNGTTSTIADAPPANSPGEFVPGQVISGRYTLREVLGEGGMGAVYRAEQSQPVKRQVALKLIKTGMDSRAVLARFDAERQALALMDHPNIARVYDGGATEANQPFFVMELVNGVAITEYCDQHRLPVRARLELFVAVCQAVQHAHQKGIIHRDLKPSNVLVCEVDGRPTPKVIDFGVAKATEFPLTDQSLADTGAIVGTPTYMSPEQADPSSMDIDTRTDIYALGVILYELLAGSPPIDAKQFRRGAFLEMLRMVREVDPPRPSTRVSTADALPNIAASRGIDPEQLKRALRGDLDWIVMKAIEKDRTRRYETANGFGVDVMRHLASDPVLAAPPSRAYRMRKFVRKHRGGVIAASLVAVALLAGFAGTTWGLIQAAKANDRLSASLDRETKAKNSLARANADLTRSRAAVQQRYELAVDAIRTFHTGVSGDFLLKEEKFKALRDQLLTSASDFYGKLGALLDKETDPASRRALAQSNFELAELTTKVARYEDALAAHRAVLTAREAQAAEPGADPGVKADVGRSLNAVASLLERRGKTDEAIAVYRRSESLLAGLAGSDPAALAALADCRARLGYLLEQGGIDLDAARAAHEAALSDRRALAAARPDDVATTVELAKSLDVFGHFKEKTGMPDALGSFREGRGLMERAAAAESAVTAHRDLLAHLIGHVGNRLAAEGQLAEAEVEFRAALALQRKLVDDNPAVSAFRNRLAGGHGELGRLLLYTGKPSEAEVEVRAALALQRKLVDDNPTATEFRHSLASSHLLLGEVLSNTGRPSEAEAEDRVALALLQKLVDDDPDTVFRSELAYEYLRIAALQAWSGRKEELAATRQRILGLARGTNQVLTAVRAAQVINLVASTDEAELESALTLARTAVELGKGGEWNLLALGIAEYRSGHFAEADAALIAAAEANKGSPFKKWTKGTSSFFRAMSLFRQGKIDEARKLATEAAAKMKPLPADEQNPLLGDADHDDLILWLAYKEAKALIQFDAAPAAPAQPDRK